MLDMGVPVFIVDLAKQLIRLSGLEPGKDIEIRYTGIREGEKLCEELVVTGEKMSRTDHRKIFALRGASADPARNRAWLSRLVKLLEGRELDALRAHMRELIPEFCPPQPISMVGPVETTLGKPARSAFASAAGGSVTRKVG